MKIGYIASCYPAVSHTFILREIQMLREKGISVETFSIRKPQKKDILGPLATKEAEGTRWLVPPGKEVIVKSLIWTLITRPLRTLTVLAHAVGQRNLAFKERFLWCCYFFEAVILAHWLKQEKIDHLHCHFGNSGSSTAMLAAELAELPFSLTCHGSELLEAKRFRLSKKIKQAAFVACVSYYGKSQLMMNSSVEQWKKLHVVRCGLVFNGETVAPDIASRKKIVCVGRFSPEKGHWVLLDALAVLHRQGCEFSCTLVGDGPLRKNIENRITELELNQNVILTGSLASDQVYEHYRTANVVVLASFSEGVPVVLMEAMGFGCTVIATQVGGVPELVKNGVTGLLVPPGNSQELASAIRWVQENPQQATALGRNAGEYVRKEFQLQTGVDQLISLFKQSVHSKN